MPCAMPPCTWPSHQQRVHDRARVVDGRQAQHADITGVGVDLDDRHVRPERERGAAGGEVVVGVEAAGAARRPAPASSTRTVRRARGRRRRPGRRRSRRPRAIRPRSSLACSSMSRAETTTAEPATCSERDAKVPSPRATRAVSECTHADARRSVRRAWRMPIWANAVSWPCPCGDTPTATSIVPSAGDRDGRVLGSGEGRDLDVARDAHAQQPPVATGRAERPARGGRRRSPASASARSSASS